MDPADIFKSVSQADQVSLASHMKLVNFVSNTYICKQGEPGLTFYIITDGSCTVTIDGEGESRQEIGRLHTGEFFGEVALFHENQQRTANVIADGKVSCMCVTKSIFMKYLGHLETELRSFHLSNRNVNIGMGNHDFSLLRMSRGAIKDLVRRRRICGCTIAGVRDGARCKVLMKIFSKFMVEALWSSMYGRMYRSMMLSPSCLSNYGRHAESIMTTNSIGSLHRHDIVPLIIDISHRIFAIDPFKRTADDHSFILGLLSQRNALKDKICRSWGSGEYASLCRHMKLFRVTPGRKIFEANSSGSACFVILRGVVRIFEQRQMRDGSQKLIFREDLMSGEVVGEEVLGGSTNRLLTAQTITYCDLAYIEYSDYLGAKTPSGESHMTVEEIYYLLLQMPLLRDWDKVKVYILAQLVRLKNCSKATTIAKSGVESKDFYFIIQGTVDILISEENPIALTTLNKFDYFGESGFLNWQAKAGSKRYDSKSKTGKAFHHTESCLSVTSTFVTLLVLSQENFDHIDDPQISTVIAKNFATKAQWRTNRAQIVSTERRKIVYQQKMLQNSLPLIQHNLNHPQSDAISNQNNKWVKLLDESTTNTGGASSLEEHKNDSARMLKGDIQAGYKNMDDIPYILNSNMDYLMVKPVCKSRAKLESITSLMLEARKRMSSAGSARPIYSNTDQNRDKAYSTSRAGKEMQALRDSLDCLEPPSSISDSFSSHDSIAALEAEYQQQQRQSASQILISTSVRRPMTSHAKSKKRDHVSQSSINLSMSMDSNVGNQLLRPKSSPTAGKKSIRTPDTLDRLLSIRTALNTTSLSNDADNPALSARSESSQELLYRKLAPRSNPTNVAANKSDSLASFVDLVRLKSKTLTKQRGILGHKKA